MGTKTGVSITQSIGGFRTMCHDCFTGRTFGTPEQAREWASTHACPAASVFYTNPCDPITIVIERLGIRVSLTDRETMSVIAGLGEALAARAAMMAADATKDACAIPLTDDERDDEYAAVEAEIEQRTTLNPHRRP